jgi:hypothetical protein
MIAELEVTCMDVFMARFNLLSWNFRSLTEEHREISQIHRCPGPDTNLALPEYESEGLLAEPPCSLIKRN